MTFIIEQDFGKYGKQGLINPEDSREDIVRHVYEWQYDGLLRIIELSEPTGLSGKQGAWIDVTEDIAREVRDLLVNEQCVPPYKMRDWLDWAIPGPSFHWPMQAAE